MELGKPVKLLLEASDAFKDLGHGVEILGDGTGHRTSRHEDRGTLCFMLSGRRGSERVDSSGDEDEL